MVIVKKKKKKKVKKKLKKKKKKKIMLILLGLRMDDKKRETMFVRTVYVHVTVCVEWDTSLENTY